MDHQWLENCLSRPRKTRPSNQKDGEKSPGTGFAFDSNLQLHVTPKNSVLEHKRHPIIITTATTIAIIVIYMLNKCVRITPK